MSTHPPTKCGLATFNSALAGHLATAGGKVGIVQVNGDGHPATLDPRVVHRWPTRQDRGWEGALTALNSFDVTIIQHEYGIYPGDDGEDILEVVSRLATPSIVVLHTVLAAPTARQKFILEQIVNMADTIVTMTDTARLRLLVGYAVDGGKVVVIPHGATAWTNEPFAAIPRRVPVQDFLELLGVLLRELPRLLVDRCDHRHAHGERHDVLRGLEAHQTPLITS